MLTVVISMAVITILALLAAIIITAVVCHLYRHKTGVLSRHDFQLCFVIKKFLSWQKCAAGPVIAGLQHEPVVSCIS